MKQSADLRRLLENIDHKSYPAYKDVRGQYSFGEYLLSIDHVQGDPFAAPSKLSIQIPHQKAAYPAALFDTPWKQTALEDDLVRHFAREIAQFNFKAKGSGKSGLIAISTPGPEILSRTACQITKTAIIARFEVGFPAFGRTINSAELIKILFEFLPRCVKSVFFFANRMVREVQAVADLADDQHFIREELSRLGLCAFVADGAILPRESGVSSRPMKSAVAFSSPENLRVTLTLPHKGKITGMGIRRGITLIVGGGYHGKSTLLKALELGVYNHIAGDGREYVITDETAMKLRAEDGRSINNVDISLFINDLPNKKDTHRFCTLDASGSTSQAAGVIEAIESKSRLFLIDEDTSATNFMLRDELMQKIIRRDKEPITPFIERARDLYEKADISTILVAGSSGAYFYIADTIIQMDSYVPADITAHTKEVCAKYGEDPTKAAPGFALPQNGRKLTIATATCEKSSDRRGGYSNRGQGRGGDREERIKTKTFGKDSLQVGKEQVDLRFVEQLVHSEQTAALAQMIRYCLEKQLFSRLSVTQIVDELTQQIQKGGLSSISDSSYAAMGLCLPRRQEIFACLNRYRG